MQRRLPLPIEKQREQPTVEQRSGMVNEAFDLQRETTTEHTETLSARLRSSSIVETQCLRHRTILY